MKLPKHAKAFRANKAQSDEKIYRALDGYIGKLMGTGDDKQINGALILTNKRLVFYSKTLLSEVLRSIYYQDISSLDQESSLGQNTIRIVKRSGDFTFKTLGSSNQVEAFIQDCNKVLSHLRNASSSQENDHTSSTIEIDTAENTLGNREALEQDNEKKNKWTRWYMWVLYLLLFSLMVNICSGPGLNDSEPVELSPEEQAKADSIAMLDARQKKIEDQFSAWDGSHIKLEFAIKKQMNDPKSYEHVETAYYEENGVLVIRTKFRGANAFGALVLTTALATATIEDGTVLTLDFLE